VGKNEAWVKVGSVIGATMCSYLVLEFVVKQMAPLWKAAIVGAVGVIALIVAFWGGRRPSQPDKVAKRTAIGVGIATKGNVTIENVDINTGTEGNVGVGSDISAKKDVQIKNILVGPKGKIDD
jgi:hypothetical protein